MAAAARLTARAIGPLVRRWRAFWDVDHVAPRFYTPAEFEAVEEARQEAWDAAVKRMAVRHVKTQVLPRVNVDLSQGLTSAAVTVRPRAAPLSGDLYEKNRLAFHLLHIVPMLLLGAVTVATLEYLTTDLDAGGLRNHYNNRTVLNKRLQVLEEAFGITRESGGGDGAGGKAAVPGAAAAPAVVAGAPAVEAPAAAAGTHPRPYQHHQHVATSNTTLGRRFDAEIVAVRAARLAGASNPLGAIGAAGPAPASAAAAAATGPPAEDSGSNGAAAVAALERRLAQLEAELARLTLDRRKGDGGGNGAPSQPLDACRDLASDGVVASGEAAAPALQPPPPPPAAAAVQLEESHALPAVEPSR